MRGERLRERQNIFFLLGSGERTRNNGLLLLWKGLKAGQKSGFIWAGVLSWLSLGTVLEL